MRRKYLFAGLLGAVGLSLLLLRSAWPQVAGPKAKKGFGIEEFSPIQPAPPRATVETGYPPQNLPACLEVLRGIRDERKRHEEEYKKAIAALDKREKDLARVMLQLIEVQRQEIATAEEELKKIAPRPAEHKEARTAR